MQKLLLILKWILGKTSRVISSFELTHFKSNFQNDHVVKSTSYNMVTAADEPYYLEQYWQVIEPYLKNIPTNPRNDYFLSKFIV
jgi:hypothetical protein